MMYLNIEIGILLMAIFCHTSVVEGGPLLCVSTEPLVEEAYGPEHYNDLVYVKNVIMELARKLHEILSLKTSTRLCHKLEKIKTSWFSVYNIKRSEGDYDEKFQLIEKAALSMLDDFIGKVAKAVDRFPIEDQKSLAGAIDTAKQRLTDSNVYKENEGTLIFEKLDQLKRTFCPDTLFTRRMDLNWLSKVNKNPFSNGVPLSTPLSNVYGEHPGAPNFSQAELEKFLTAQLSAHGSIPYHSAGNHEQNHEPLPESPFIKELPSESSFATEVLQQTKPVLVNFHAGWCKACRIFAPRLCNVVIKNGGEVLLVRVDTDEKKHISATYKAQSLPLTIGFKNGREVNRFVGALADSDVQDFINMLKSS